MNNLGEIIKKLRLEKKLPLRSVSSYLAVDQAILSKIERGQRKASRELIPKLASYFEANEDDLMVAWLSDKIVYEVESEKMALKALQMAEDQIKYHTFKNSDKTALKKQITAALSKFVGIHQAWIYGSFSRGDDKPGSDIDIAVQTDEKFSYFDLAEVQNQLEKLIERKVDIGFMDAFKPYIYDHVKPDLKLIYERHPS
jgi:predicted nucleotidyltransferase